MKKKTNTGQGLVEFALILPLLLLVLLGIVEFGRIFFIYSNLFNAAREGARFGITSPRHYDGISQTTHEAIMAVGDDDVDVWVWYDKGPNDPDPVSTNPDDVAVGNRVVVYLEHEVRPLTPLFEPFTRNVVVRTSAARTIQSLGHAVTAPPPGPPPGGGGGVTYTPTPSPTATATATSTATPTPTNTPDPVASPTPVVPTSTPQPTSTATPTPQPLIINQPLNAGDIQVTGSAQPGESVTLRCVQTGLQRTVIVDAQGIFTFGDLPALIGGSTIVVQGYGHQDSAVVQGGTPTPSPTPTPVPSTGYITVDPQCGPIGHTQTITVTGHNWPTGNQADTFIYWDGMELDSWNNNPSPDFQKTYTVELTEGSHTVRATAGPNASNVKHEDSVNFISPCAEPDLIVTGLSLLNEEPIGTYEKIDVSVGVRNQGGADVPSLFWVDLFADTAPTNTVSSEDYVAVNGLPAGATISFTMWVENGFEVTGTHTLSVLADTWNQIMEIDETNNTGGPITVTVSVTNPVPTPTPTPDVPSGPLGTIWGITYLDGVPQSLVNVYVYDTDGRLVWSGKSETVQDDEGNVTRGYYEADLPAGDYVVVGKLRMADGNYEGQTTVSNLVAGEIREYVDINLTSITGSTFYSTESFDSVDDMERDPIHVQDK
jgi:Flp pilus assembly protein TadG